MSEQSGLLRRVITGEHYVPDEDEFAVLVDRLVSSKVCLPDELRQRFAGEVVELVGKMAKADDRTRLVRSFRRALD